MTRCCELEKVEGIEAASVGVRYVEVQKRSSGLVQGKAVKGYEGPLHVSFGGLLCTTTWSRPGSANTNRVE